jgi:soluble lytic murein transglycosylase
MQGRQWLIAGVMLSTLAVMSFLIQREDAVPHRHVPEFAPPGDTLTARGVPAEVTEFLRNGQSWRAARRMRELLRATPDPAPEAVLLAARAEAGWGGWEETRAYLEGKPWLDTVRDGEGWYWLGRALEEDREWEPALNAYGRFLAGDAARGEEDRRRVAELRRGLILLRLGRAEEGARLLEGMREHAPEVAPWVDALAAEALAERGDTARVRALIADAANAPGEVLWRGRSALVKAYEEAGDRAGARDLALSFAGQRADFAVRAARLSLALGDTAAARRELRRAVAASPGVSAGRAAADLLLELPGLEASDRLAIARVLDRHGIDRRAWQLYGAWLQSGAGSPAEREEVRLLMGRALFANGQYAAAQRELRPLVGSASAARAAAALHLIGRAQYRGGSRAQAMETWMQLARRYPGTEAGSEALFLVADLSHDAGNVGRAKPLYRRVASEFRGRDRAGLSLMRLGGVEFLERDFAAAAAAWDEYRAAYPTGERWLEAAYWGGRAREAAGDASGAAELYRAVRERDPLSYYALRASQRLGEPYWPIPLAPSPEDDPEIRRRVEGWMHGVDLLRVAGLYDEAEAEADRWIDRAEGNRELLYALAETLNERGLTVRGIRIGLRLQREEARANERLLKILYPFPYRAMIEAEAREKELDPFLVAALTRQESLFKARITSPVGARGLMQIMPETGEVLARGVGIRNWDAELLYQPEINAHLGTRYLAEQMRRWDGSLPSVFSAYNAGPHRVEDWKEFPEYRDEELFTERIPYRETRDYVKILTRNIALYRALYGAEGSAGDP